MKTRITQRSRKISVSFCEGLFLFCRMLNVLQAGLCSTCTSSEGPGSSSQVSFCLLFVGLFSVMTRELHSKKGLKIEHYYVED